MNRKKLFLQVFALTSIILLLVGCGGALAEPTATPTPVPPTVKPTATPTSIPPTATHTSIPPTATPTPIPNPTATATSEVVVPNDGNWSGTTSQGRDISLLVVSNGTEIDMIKIYVGWGDACPGVVHTIYYFYDAVINNASFYKSKADGEEVEGTFTSPDSASGDFYAGIENDSCRATTSGTWTANYVP